jgi:SAM-dependent methyltransferase
MSAPQPGGGSAARYDGHADWYDAWARSDGAAAMASAQAVLGELVPAGNGLALDLGCGTGLHADVIRRRGYRALGLDVSADQVRLARTRMPVVRADGRAVPLCDGVARLVVSVLTHTDVEDFAGLVGEAVRVLAPGGCFVYVGVHPCFVSPVAERLGDGVRLHPGYRVAGWQERTPFTGNAVRSRVGVHHLPLQDLLAATLHADAPLDAVLERGGDAVPELLGLRLRRPTVAGSGTEVGTPAPCPGTNAPPA